MEFKERQTDGNIFKKIIHAGKFTSSVWMSFKKNKTYQMSQILNLHQSLTEAMKTIVINSIIIDN